MTVIDKKVKFYNRFLIRIFKVWYLTTNNKGLKRMKYSKQKEMVKKFRHKKDIRNENMSCPSIDTRNLLKINNNAILWCRLTGQNLLAMSWVPMLLQTPQANFSKIMWRKQGQTVHRSEVINKKNNKTKQAESKKYREG